MQFLLMQTLWESESYNVFLEKNLRDEWIVLSEK